MLSNNLMDEATPLAFYLSQNYPNPFKEKTVIKYCIAYKTRVILTVYNTGGELIEKLVDEEKQPGTYEVKFDASTCHSTQNGNPIERNFFYRLEAGEYLSEKNMTLQI